MTKYLITFTVTGAKLLISYKNKFVVDFELEGELDLKRYVGMADRFPWHESEIEKIWLKQKNIRVKKVDRDLTFKAFWDEYEHKVGNKSRSQKLWDKLSDTNKAGAIDYLPKYEGFLAMNKGIAKLYPETYLNQQRWNN